MRKSIIGKVAFGFAIAISTFGFATTLFAELVSVDFNSLYAGGGASGTYTGPAVVSEGADFWNGWLVPAPAPETPYIVTPDSTSPILKNSNNATTSAAFGTNVTVTLVGGGWGQVDWSYNGTPNWAPALTGDGLYGGTTFRIGGLVAGASYDLYLYSQNGNYYNSATSHIVGGIQKDTTNDASLGSSTYISGKNYVSYLGVTANGSGQISGDIGGIANGSSFNGFQLSQVPTPEPNSLTLICLGAIGLFRVARRRRIG